VHRGVQEKKSLDESTGTKSRCRQRQGYRDMVTARSKIGSKFKVKSIFDRYQQRIQTNLQIDSTTSPPTIEGGANISILPTTRMLPRVLEPLIITPLLQNSRLHCWLGASFVDCLRVTNLSRN